MYPRSATKWRADIACGGYGLPELALALAESRPAIVMVLDGGGEGVDPSSQVASGLCGANPRVCAIGQVAGHHESARLSFLNQDSNTRAGNSTRLVASWSFISAENKTTTKPVPATYDDWPQYFYDGAASDKSQRHRRWPGAGDSMTGTKNLRG